MSIYGNSRRTNTSLEIWTPMLGCICNYKAQKLHSVSCHDLDNNRLSRIRHCLVPPNARLLYLPFVLALTT